MSWLKKIFKREPPPPPPRRGILNSVEAVEQSPDAMQLVVRSVAKYPPGNSSRWTRMLEEITFLKEPTEEDPDPVRVTLQFEQLKSILRHLYENKLSISSDGLALSREFIPELYDKHSIARAQAVSQRERESKTIDDECFAYGEVDYEIFAAMFLRFVSVYGERADGIFYDLGCGPGMLVYEAAFIGNFRKVIGVEAIGALLVRGEKRLGRWERSSDRFTDRIQKVIVDFIEDDFILNGFYADDATFIFLHWTALSHKQRMTVSDILAGCQEGTQVITFTHPIMGNNFEILVQDICLTSWGKTDFYCQEKVTPSSR